MGGMVGAESGADARILGERTPMRLPCRASAIAEPPMKVPAYLDDHQIERLAELLEQRAVPFKGFNLEALDGYLSALAVAPGDDARSSSGRARSGARRRAGRTRTSAPRSRRCCRATGTWSASACASATTTCPTTWRRCCGCPRIRKQEQEDELDVGRDWAFGFFRGVELSEIAVGQVAGRARVDRRDLPALRPPGQRRGASAKTRSSRARRSATASAWRSSPACRACSPTCTTTASTR